MEDLNSLLSSGTPFRMLGPPWFIWWNQTLWFGLSSYIFELLFYFGNEHSFVSPDVPEIYYLK